MKTTFTLVLIAAPVPLSLWQSRFYLRHIDLTAPPAYGDGPLRTLRRIGLHSRYGPTEPSGTFDLVAEPPVFVLVAWIASAAAFMAGDALAM